MSSHSLRAAPCVQPDRGGPRCQGWRVAMAGKHPAPWGPRVRRVTCCAPVGAHSSALLPQVSFPTRSSLGPQRKQGRRGAGVLPGGKAEAGPAPSGLGDWAPRPPQGRGPGDVSSPHTCCADGHCHPSTTCAWGHCAWASCHPMHSWHLCGG